MRHHLNFPIPGAIDLHNLPQIADPVIHLDLVVQELLERAHVEDLVRGGLRRVDDEFLRDLAALLVLAAGAAEGGCALGFLGKNVGVSVWRVRFGGGKGRGYAHCLGSKDVR